MTDDAPAGEVMEVTTDSPQYCQALATRVDAAALQHVEQQAEVTKLIVDGKTQCAAGHIRSGVHHLRVALMLLDGH